MNAKETRRHHLQTSQPENSKNDDPSSSKAAPRKTPKQTPEPASKKERLASLSERLKIQGNNYFKAGSYDDAIQFYTESLNAQPSSAVYANRAMAYLKLKNYAQAEKDCTLCLKLDPTYVKAYLRRAVSRKETNNLKGAIRDFEMALRYEPLNKDAEAEMKPCIDAWMAMNIAKEPQAEAVTKITYNTLSSGKTFTVTPTPTTTRNNNNNNSNRASSSTTTNNDNNITATTTATATPAKLSENGSKTFLDGWNACNGDEHDQGKYLSRIRPEQLIILLDGILTPGLLKEVLHTMLISFSAMALLFIKEYRDMYTYHELVRYLNNLPKTPGFTANIQALPIVTKAELMWMFGELSRNLPMVEDDVDIVSYYGMFRNQAEMREGMSIAIGANAL